MNFYGNIWTYFDNTSSVTLEEFQHFLRKAGLGKHKARVNRDFEGILSIRNGKVELSDLAEHYLHSFSLFKTATLNAEIALNKIKQIRKMFLNDTMHDDIALIFIKSFLGIIQKH